jgi:hypothetical protein
MGLTWYVILVVGAATAAAVAERVGSKRMRRFGDPAMLSVRKPYFPRYARSVLFVVAASAIGAIPAGLGSGAKLTAAPEISFVVDSGTLDPPGAGRSVAGSLFRATAGQFPPGSRSSIFRAGGTLEQVVPATADLDGAVMLFERLGAAEGETSSGLKEEVSHVLEENPRGQGRIAVVITRLPREQVEGLWATGDGHRVLAACMDETGVVTFGARNGNNRWTWSRDPAVPASLLQPRPPSIPLPQLFSTLSLLLLFALSGTDLRKPREQKELRRK